MTKEEQLLEQKKRIEQELVSLKKKKQAEKRAEEKISRKCFGKSTEEVQFRLEEGAKAMELIKRYLTAKGITEISLERFEGFVRGAENKVQQ